MKEQRDSLLRINALIGLQNRLRSKINEIKLILPLVNPKNKEYEKELELRIEKLSDKCIKLENKIDSLEGQLDYTKL